MKKYIAVYPGSFCPPTFGHLNIAIEAGKIFNKIIIVCSRNDCKTNYWFSQDECAKMWQSMNLPKNIEVCTFEDIKKKYSLPFSDFIAIRGIRDKKYWDEEKRSLLVSLNKFGIRKFFFVFAKPNYKNISSTQLQNFATNLDLINMAGKTTPLIISHLIEKSLDIKKIIIVAGKTGAGKTKIINQLSKINNIEYINVDLLVKELHPKVKNHFKTNNVFSLVQAQPNKVADFLEIPLIEKIQENIKKLKKAKKLNRQTILFIECAYALKYNIFRYLGGRILYIHCSKNKIRQRIIKRKTPQHLEFVDKIPDLEKTKKICRINKLQLIVFDNEKDELKEEKLNELYSKLIKS